MILYHYAIKEPIHIINFYVMIILLVYHAISFLYTLLFTKFLHNYITLR